MFELCIFSLGNSLYGVDVMRVREILRPGKITAAPLAACYVIGIYNLRGRIVTIIVLAEKLGVEGGKPDGRGRCVVVESDGEKIGLLVDSVLDVIGVDAETVEPAPSNNGNPEGKFLSGVVGTESGLAAILDLDRLLLV